MVFLLEGTGEGIPYIEYLGEYFNKNIELLTLLHNWNKHRVRNTSGTSDTFKRSAEKASEVRFLSCFPTQLSLRVKRFFHTHLSNCASQKITDIAWTGENSTRSIRTSMESPEILLDDW